MKTTVIHHSADFDGIFCREIARRFLPEADLIGWDFGDSPLSDELLRSPRLVVMDLPVDRPFGLQFKDGWICRGSEQVQPIDRWESSNIVWIDHHKSSIETHPRDIPGYRIDGVAACRLAWQWFATLVRNCGADAAWAAMPAVDAEAILPTKAAFIDRQVTEPLAVRLAGEYDIWDKRDPDAEVFQFGLRSRDLSNDWPSLLSLDRRPTIEEVERLIDVGHQGLLRPDGTSPNPTVCGLLESGWLLQRYQQQNDANMVNYRSFMVEFEGLRFVALNTARCNSLTFAAKDVPETGHDALMGFYWNGKKWSVSLYHAKHRTDIDLSKIAVAHSGGGHRGACGFTADALPFLTPNRQ